MQFESFSNLLTAPRTVSDTYALVARAQSCANYVQHIAYHVERVFRVERRGSSGIKSDRVEIASILVLFHRLKRLIDEGEGKTGVPGENP